MRNLCCSILLLVIGGLAVVQAEPPLTIAHRGGAIFAPENTIPAFLANIEQSDLIELDVYNTLDGELVVIHDTTLDRTTDGTGRVQDKTLAELKALDAGSWYAPEFAGTRIPTLEEALAAIGTDSIPLIEHKQGSAGLYVQTLQRLNRTTDVVVQSFNWSFLRSMHDYAPEIPLAALGSGELTEAKVLEIQAIGIPRVAWAHGDVQPEMVDFIHAQGMELFVWTVNGGTIEKFIDYAVDGIITDDPRLVANLTDTRPSTRTELAQDLVSYWAMDDGLNDASSRVALDCEGRNPGSVQGYLGNPKWAGGISAMSGGALYFDGVEQFVEIPASESLDLDSNSVTISMWVRLAELPSQIAGSFAGLYDSVPDCYVLYLDRGSKEIRFKVTNRDGRATRPGIPESALQLGTWHHVVGVANGNAGPVSGQALIYLDGRLMDAHSGADGQNYRFLNDLIQTGQTAAMGRNGDQATNWFKGAVDDIAIWRRALRAAEVRQIFEAGRTGVSLMQQVMDLRLLGLETITSAGGAESLQLQFRVEHGLVQPAELRLEAADSGEGTFQPEANAVIESAGDGLYLVSREGLKTQEFLRLKAGD